MRWDVFCRVIDNHGDLGVCLRLARALHRRGETVRLWADDLRALSWMDPTVAAGGDDGLRVLPWPADDAPAAVPGDVVVEAFGCDPPAAFVAAMATRATPPVWINLEYLSAEASAERCHGLPSPQMAGPGRGLTKWFYFPGFTAATGGLIREPDATAPAPPPWAAVGTAPHAPERVVTLFCYPQPPALQALLQASDRPTLLLAAPGAGAAAAATLPAQPGLRVHAMPWLSQLDYDALLHAADLNLVRGEDSFVRAQWTGRPFLWHIYPQHDGVHHDKLKAFLARHLAAAPAAVAASVDPWMRAWNGFAPAPAGLPDATAWSAHARAWRDTLAAGPELVHGLMAFARARGTGAG